MKVNTILAVEKNLSSWKRTWENSSLTGIQTLTFAMTGRIQRSIHWAYQETKLLWVCKCTHDGNDMNME